jgi:hypothetical protein
MKEETNARESVEPTHEPCTEVTVGTLETEGEGVQLIEEDNKQQGRLRSDAARLQRNE